ncbi:LysR family transcriptional regulator [Parafrigoribacterium soli]|uniref:LysR family transcriptional regulator n=1 Tax=Parafrigoribacterium soli TaxID=3144663 RepID=UPI0032EDC4F5
MLDTYRLRIFRSVVASGSIQAAARHLGFTPSAVSQQLATLQRETGLVLMERSGRGIVPTAAGRALVAASDDVIADLTRLDTVVADLREGRTGRLIVGYFASAGAAWMPRVAKTLTDEFPELVLELVLSEVADSTASLNLDIDLVNGFQHDEAAPPAGYHRRHLTDDPYIALVPSEHPLAGRESIPLAELSGEEWVDNEIADRPGRRILIAACSAAGFTPRFVVQAQEHYTAMAFVAAGVGITALPQLASLEAPRGVSSIRLSDPEPVRRISLLVKESLAGNPVAERAVELLTEYTQLAG